MMHPMCEKLRAFKQTYDLSVEREDIELTENVAKEHGLDTTYLESENFSMRKYIFTEKSGGSASLLYAEVIYDNDDVDTVFFPVILDKRVSMDLETTFLLKQDS